MAAIPVIWLVLTLTFLMLHAIPGGPFESERALSPEALAALKHYYHQDQPLLAQYFHYLREILGGNLGPSYYHSGWTVGELIRSRLGVSMELGFYAMAMAIVAGLLFGALLTVFHGGPLDRIAMTLTSLLICTPSFVLGTLLNHFFSHRLHWFNSMGWASAGDRVLPIVTLGTYYFAVITRLSRTSFHGQSQQLYVRTARAKGLSRRRILFCHILPNGIQPIISYLGPVCANVLSGTFVVETIFNIPGIGRLFIESIANRDYTLIIGVVLCYGMLILLFNLVADLLLVLINPKMKLY